MVLIKKFFDLLFGNSNKSKADYYAFLLEQAQPRELDPFQKAHNAALDREIAHCAEMRRIKQEHNDMMMQKWEEYRKKELAKDPTKLTPMFCPGFDYSDGPYVIGIRYTI
jgi:TPP-dependent pyruvate/acetoin dehydrogenase alpha subunit